MLIHLFDRWLCSKRHKVGLSDSLGLAPSSWSGGELSQYFSFITYFQYIWYFQSWISSIILGWRKHSQYFQYSSFHFSIFLIVPAWDELHHPGVEEYLKSCQERGRIGYFLDKQFNFLLHITDCLFKEVDVVNESINLYYNWLSTEITLDLMSPVIAFGPSVSLEPKATKSNPRQKENVSVLSKCQHIVLCLLETEKTASMVVN